MKKIHISFSEYRLWNQCNLKWFLSKKLGYVEPSNEFLIFGSALHAAIEEIILKKHSKVLYEGVMTKKLIKENKGIALSPWLKRKFVEQGTAILRAIDFFERYKDYEIVGVEKEMYEPLVELEDGSTFFFKGIIDLILKHKTTGEIAIIDWKSSMKPWDIDKKNEDNPFWCQLALYKHFYSIKEGVPLDKIKTQFVALVRDPASVETIDVELSDDFMSFTMLDLQRSVKEVLTFIDSDSKIAVKARLDPETKHNCQYCFFKKNSFCNEDPNQIIEPFVKPIEE